MPLPFKEWCDFLDLLLALDSAVHDDDDAAVSLLNLMWAGFLGRKDEGTLVSTCGQRGLGVSAALFRSMFLPRVSGALVRSEARVSNLL
jgi:hypothetical protein